MVYLPQPQPIPPPYSPDDLIITENEIAGLIKFAIDNMWYLSSVLSNNIANAQNSIIGQVWSGVNNINTNIAFASYNVQTAIKNSENKIIGTLAFNDLKIMDAMLNNRDVIRGDISGLKDSVLGSIQDTKSFLNTNMVAWFNQVFTRLADMYRLIKQDIAGINTGFDAQTLNEVKAIRSDLASIESRLAGGIIAQTGVILGAIGVQTLAQGAAITAQTGIIEASIVGQTAIIEGSIAAQTATILGAIGASEIVDTAGIPLIVGAILAAIVGTIGAGFPELRSVANKLLTNQYNTYQEFLGDFDRIGGTGSITKFLLDIVRLPAVLIGGVISTTKPYIENLETLARTDAKSTLLSPAQILSIFHKMGKDFSYAEDNLKKIGYRDNDIGELIGDSYVHPNPDTVRLAYVRGKIDETTHDSLLKRLGLTSQHIEIAKRLYHGIPPYQDIVRLFVREVFTPDIAETFGQFEDFPEEFEGYINQLGLEPHWAKKLWAGHWDLPSATQGFDMFHRGIINHDQLVTLLRSLDVMPFWRDKLIRLAYDVPRLVDIRRWYEDGVINDGQVLKYYKDRGYADTEAQFATQWTIQQASKGTFQERGELRSFTVSMIARMYQRGILNYDTAIIKLKELRYTENDANLILALYDYKEESDRREDRTKDNLKRLEKLANDGYGSRLFNYEESKDILLTAGFTDNEAIAELDLVDYEYEKRLKGHIVDWYKELYVTWVIDLDQFNEGLTENGFTQDEIQKLQLEFDILRETRTKRPAQAQLERWYIDGLIDKERYANELRGLGFGEPYVTLFILEHEEIEQ